MRKVLKSISFILLALVMLIPSTTVFAAEEEVPEWQDITMSDEELDEFLAPYMVDNTMSRASGLIAAYGIAIQKSGTSLKIAGKTACVGFVQPTAGLSTLSIRIYILTPVDMY